LSTGVELKGGDAVPQRRKYHPTPLLAPMIDLFVLTLLVLLLRKPVFGVDEGLLPVLKAPPASAAPTSTAKAGTGLEARLRLDGVALWKKEEVPVEKLAERIAAETSEQEKVTLVVEVDGQGKGALRQLLQFQLDADRVRIGPRLRVLQRTAADRKGGSP
jgi:biopolymer transport protein ExbD